EGAKPKRLLREAPADMELGSETLAGQEELSRVVAGLPVNVHGRREVGRARVVEPIVVGEPGIGRRDRDELARARVVESDRLLPLLVQDLLDAGERLESRPRPTEILGVAHVAVRDLVIRDGERPRGAGVEQLPAERLLDGQEPRAAEGTV